MCPAAVGTLTKQRDKHGGDKHRYSALVVVSEKSHQPEPHDDHEIMRDRDDDVSCNILHTLSPCGGHAAPADLRLVRCSRGFHDGLEPFLAHVHDVLRRLLRDARLLRYGVGRIIARSKRRPHEVDDGRIDMDTFDICSSSRWTSKARGCRRLRAAWLRCAARRPYRRSSS